MESVIEYRTVEKDVEMQSSNHCAGSQVTDQAQELLVARLSDGRPVLAGEVADTELIGASMEMVAEFYTATAWGPKPGAMKYDGCLCAQYMQPQFTPWLFQAGV